LSVVFQDELFLFSGSYGIFTHKMPDAIPVESRWISGGNPRKLPGFLFTYPRVPNRIGDVADAIGSASNSVRFFGCVVNHGTIVFLQGAGGMTRARREIG
jgi:hypothetical protein